MLDLRRRHFITLLGGAAAWPLAARAQQATGKMRRIGVLMNLAADDPESMAVIGAFLHGLHQLGWVDGRNVVIHYRWGAGDHERIRKSAQELVALAGGRRYYGFAIAAGKSECPDSVRDRYRSCRRWYRFQLGATRREHHWIYEL
jgi:hypothetical protein